MMLPAFSLFSGASRRSAHHLRLDLHLNRRLRQRLKGATLAFSPPARASSIMGTIAFALRRPRDKVAVLCADFGRQCS